MGTSKGKTHLVFSPELRAQLSKGEAINRAYIRQCQLRQTFCYVGRTLTQKEFNQKYIGPEPGRIATRLEEAVMILGGCDNPAGCALRSLHGRFEYCDTCDKVV